MNLFQKNTEKQKDTYFLIDAMALLYRAYYVFIRAPRITSQGKNVSALYGFISVLLALMEKYSPDNIIVVFDSATPTFRHEKFAEYKAEREPPPKALIEAIPELKRILDAWKIPYLQIDGYEADDIIGTLAKKLEKEGNKVYIFSADKDYIQLLDNNIFLLRPKPKEGTIELIKKEDVKDYIGFEPEYMTDFLALQGDKSDGIPGVKGIGEKTAKKLIQQFGHIENLLAHLDEVKAKRAKNALEAEKDKLPFYKELATIFTQVPLPENFEFKTGDPDKKALAKLFKEFEFNQFLQKTGLRKFLQEDSETPSLFETSLQIHLIKNKEERSKLLEKLRKASKISFSLQPQNLQTLIGSDIAGMAIACNENESFFLSEKLLDKDFLQELFTLKKVFLDYNLKKDFLLLKQQNISLPEEYFDIMIADFVADPEQSHELEKILLRYFGKSLPLPEILNPKKNFSLQNIEPSHFAAYLCEKVHYNFKLYYLLKTELEKVPSLQKLYQTLESPLVKIIAEMEFNGIRLDADFLLGDLNKTLTHQIEKLQEEIFTMAGTQFNINSPKQLGEVLYGKLKLPVLDKTKTGQLSTSERTLTKLAQFHELPAYILEYRKLVKLKNTYVEALPKLINPQTGKIHTTFNQIGTVTGRMSSKDPNLQNIPIRDALGREIRKAFVPSRENYLLISADYSQIELRILAHLSEDPNMIEAFKQNKDIHRATASLLYDVPEEEVTREMRRKAKMVNYGLIYGMGAFGLAERLGIPRKEAKHIIETYFAKYPTIKSFIEKAIESAKQKGYAESLFGRRHYLPNLKSPNKTVRQYAERNAINSPIQGTAADIIKMAMNNLYDKIRNSSLKMLLQVHDELVFEAPAEEVNRWEPIIKREMENVVSLKVPLVVDIGTGKSWFDAH